MNNNAPSIPPASINCIADLSSLAKDTPVLAVTGTITSVEKRYEAEGQWGPFSFQNGVITDGSATFPVVFSNRPDFIGIGQTVRFTLGQSKGGLTGIKISEREDRNTKRRHLVLMIGKAAQEQFHAGTPVPSYVQPVAVAPNIHPQAQPPAPPAPQDYHTSVTEARQTLGRMANLYHLCIMTGNYVETCYMEENDGSKMPESHKQAAISSMFIEANKLQLLDKCPVHSVNDYIVERTPAPPAPQH